MHYSPSVDTGQSITSRSRQTGESDVKQATATAAGAAATGSEVPAAGSPGEACHSCCASVYFVRLSFNPTPVMGLPLRAVIERSRFRSRPSPTRSSAHRWPRRFYVVFSEPDTCFTHVTLQSKAHAIQQYKPTNPAALAPVQANNMPLAWLPAWHKLRNSQPCPPVCDCRCEVHAARSPASAEGTATRSPPGSRPPALMLQRSWPT